MLDASDAQLNYRPTILSLTGISGGRMVTRAGASVTALTLAVIHQVLITFDK